MAVCWVKAGICGKEVVIKAIKTSQIKVEITFETSCEYVKNLSKELKEINIGEELSRPMNETTIYSLAARHLCRNSCIVPGAIFKAVEVAANVFRPDSSKIEFINEKI